MDYFSAAATAVTLVTLALKVPVNFKKLNKRRMTVYMSKSATVRAVLKWADRNHLTSRTREDIFYDTRFHFEEDAPTALSCIMPRVPVRPQSFLRKMVFDYNMADRPQYVLLDSYFKIRAAFRNITSEKIREQVEQATAAPGNNHRKACVCRNAASALLASFANGISDEFFVFSLSGSAIERNACDAAFRGIHQPSDAAQELVAHAGGLSAHPSIWQPAHGDNAVYPTPQKCIAISTDTTNHLSPREKAAILGNGICLASYSPGVMINSNELEIAEVLAERSSFWEDGVLKTAVNGGGSYSDTLWENNVDIEICDCPDGDLMFIYVERVLDPFDNTHIFVGEFPYAKIARNSPMYNEFKDRPRIGHFKPYNLKFTHPVTQIKHDFSSVSVRHSDCIQITDNVTRRTCYFTRAELSSVASLAPGRRTNIELDVRPPTIAGVKLNIKAAERGRMIEAIGHANMHLLLHNSPECDFPSPATASRQAATDQVLLQMMVNGETPSLLEGLPEDQKLEIKTKFEEYQAENQFVLKMLSLFESQNKIMGDVILAESALRQPLDSEDESCSDFGE